MIANERVRRVLVVGGGVGGMAAAIRLRDTGRSVDLLELDPTWRAVGAGLTLNGATLRALARLGILDAVMAAGHIHGGRRIHDINGAVIADTPAYRPARDDIGAGGGILRPALHAILSDRVKATGANVRLGVSITGLREEEGGVVATIADGGDVRYDLVVGADGIMSRVRQLVFPDAAAPVFTGQGCWRAVFPRPQEVATNWIFVGRDTKIGFNPVSEREMYMFLLETAPQNPWLDPDAWPRLLAERMRRVGGLVGELAERVGTDTQTNYRPLETLLMPPPWHRGRTVLIGDAAHATTPHAGYGAGLAIEDAIVLVDCLDAAESLDGALIEFAARRYERCSAVLDQSIALGGMEMANAPIDDQLAASAALFARTREPF